MILHCSRNIRLAEYAIHEYADEGFEISASRMEAYKPALGLTVRFMAFNTAQDAYKIQGLEFVGVLNFDAVLDSECRGAIRSRLRLR